jgi:hypothetical protein
MLRYRRFMMIALAVAMVCLPAGVHGCGGTGGTAADQASTSTPGQISQATTTEFSSSAGGSNSDPGSQQQAMLDSSGQVSVTIKIKGTLQCTTSVNMGGASNDQTEVFTIEGTMTGWGEVGPSSSFGGRATVSVVQTSTITVPEQGVGSGYWSGADGNATLWAGPSTTVSGYGPGLSGAGTITYKCKGSGWGQWPGGKKTASQLK